MGTAVSVLLILLIVGVPLAFTSGLVAVTRSRIMRRPMAHPEGTVGRVRDFVEHHHHEHPLDDRGDESA